jgi:hypothetical protein
MESEFKQATHTSPPSSATDNPSGECFVPVSGKENSATVSSFVSRRDTESLSGLAVHTMLPSAVIWMGPLLKCLAPAARPSDGMNKNQQNNRVNVAGRTQRGLWENAFMVTPSSSSLPRFDQPMKFGWEKWVEGIQQ